jgi:3-oxoacyl-[acyl-carrier-protein] synthase II
MSSRIFITGAGVISSIGAGLEDFERALYAGASGAGPSAVLAAGLPEDASPEPQACEVREFSPQTWLGNKGIRVLDRTARLLCVAAQMALKGVEGRATPSDPAEADVDTGLVCGTMFGSLHSITSFDWSGLEDGVNLVNPMDFPNTVINSAAGQAAIKFKLGGINSTICAAQASGLYAIHYAAEFLRLGRAQLLLAGGVEELSPESYLGFRKNGWLADAAAVPFSDRANGMLLGEGAALLALQRGEQGQKVLAEVVGFGAAHDGLSAQEFNTDAAGATEAIGLALESAGISAEQIGCIVSSANGSRAADLMELRALRHVFGERLQQVPMCAPKAALGDALGAGGAFGALCAALALWKQCLPPTVGGGGREGLAVSSQTQALTGEFALINAFSCDGNNAAMVLRQCR